MTHLALQRSTYRQHIVIPALATRPEMECNILKSAEIPIHIVASEEEVDVQALANEAGGFKDVTD